MVGGQLAVQAFYMISGFYMTLVLKEKYIGQNKSYKLFLGNRFLRLYPTYWFILILTVLLSLFAGAISDGVFWLRLQPYFTNIHAFNFGSLIPLFLANLLLIGQDWIMFLGIDPSTSQLFFTTNFWKTDPQLYTFLLVPQAWTIGVEITFYLVAPLLVRLRFFWIVLIALFSLLFRLVLISKGLSHDPWSYRFFPNELLFFMLGTIAYYIYKRLQKLKLSSTWLWTPTLLVILNTLFFASVEIPHKYEIYLTEFFLALPFIFLYSKDNKFDQKIGDLSYPVYMSHMLFVMIIGKLSFITNILGEGITVALSTILLSILINHFIANPLEKFRQRRVVSNKSL